MNVSPNLFGIKLLLGISICLYLSVCHCIPFQFCQTFPNLKDDLIDFHRISVRVELNNCCVTYFKEHTLVIVK